MISSEDADAGPRPVEGRHALYCGWVVAQAEGHGVVVEPVLTADGELSDHFRVVRTDDGIAVTIVIPSPPEDWLL